MTTKTLTLFLLLGFVSLSVFGFVGMLESADMEHTTSICLASLAQNGVCPPPEHTVASALFHTSAFKVFSTTVLSGFALLLTLTLFVGRTVSFVPLLRSGARSLAERLSDLVSRYQSHRRVRFALARLEHSPTR